MKPLKYYRDAVIYPSLFVVLFCIVFALIARLKGTEQTDNTALVATIVSALIFSLIMSGLSLPIFLNKIKGLHRKLIWNLLSWFLLPLSYIALVFLHDLKIRTRFDFGFGKDFFFLLLVTLPFLLSLVLTLIRYRQDLKSADIAKP